MQTEAKPVNAISQDMLLTMQHLLPMLATLIAALQNAEAGTRETVADLQSVMERIATGLEVQTQQLQAWDQRLAAQEAGLATLSRQIRGLARHFGSEKEERASLENKLATVIALLTE